MKKILLTFDIEEFDLPLEYGVKISEKEQFGISKKGSENVLDLLDKSKVKGTFFITASFALKFPKLIKQIAKKHEIGCHGLYHSDIYSKMNDKEIVERLKKAKKILEKIAGRKIFSFRAQRLQKVSYGLLKKAGFTIDSSLFPTFVYLGKYKLGRFENLFSKRKVFEKNGIKVYPLATTPSLPFIFLRLPLNWITFRNLGLWYAKICSLLGFLNNSNLTLIFHPWEFVDLKKFKINSFVKNKTGKELEKELEQYISWAKKQGFKFEVMG